MADQYDDPNEAMVSQMPPQAPNEYFNQSTGKNEPLPAYRGELLASAGNGAAEQRNFASASSFFATKADIVTEETYFPEKKQWLRFKAVTQAEFRRAQLFCTTHNPRTLVRTPQDDKDLNIALFIAGAVNADGSHVFTLRDYDALMREPYAVIDRGSQIVARLSGIGEDVLSKGKRRDDFDAADSDDAS